MSGTRSVSEERGEGVVSRAKASLLPSSGVDVALLVVFPALVFSFARLITTKSKDQTRSVHLIGMFTCSETRPSGRNVTTAVKMRKR